VSLVRHAIFLLILLTASLAQAQGFEEPIAPKEVPRDIARDQKRIWTFPKTLVHGEHWKPALGVAVTTAALVVLDPHDAPYFRKTGAFGDCNKSRTESS
jgi:hypothetical protein